MEKLEYMEGMVLVKEKIIVYIRKDKYFYEDIYDYIRDITLTQLHKKFDDVRKLIKNG